MKADIVVVTKVNDQPPYAHVRQQARGPEAINRAFHEVCQDEFERASRAKADIGYRVVPGSQRVDVWYEMPGSRTDVTIEVRPR